MSTPAARLAVRATLAPHNADASSQDQATPPLDGRGGEDDASVASSTSISASASASEASIEETEDEDTVHASGIERSIRQGLLDGELPATLKLQHAGTPESSATLAELISRLEQHSSILKLQALTASASIAECKRTFVEACNAIHLVLRSDAGQLSLSEHAGEEGYFVANGVNEVKLELEQGRRPDMTLRPDVLLLHADREPMLARQSSSSEHSFLFLQLLSVGKVKAHGKGGRDGRGETLVLELSRYVYSLIRDNACVAVCHAFALVGSSLRIFRYDSQCYCVSDPIDVTDSTQLEKLILFVSFLTDKEQSLVKFTPTSDFGVLRETVASEQTKVELWRWIGAPRVLEVLQRLFGRRTCCWAGQARSSNNRYDDRSLVVKLSWLPSDAITHELDVLRVLNSKGVQGVPTLFGSLEIPSEIAASHVASNDIKRHDSLYPTRYCGLTLATVVSECPIGSPVDKHTSLLELLQVYRHAGRILRDVAQACIVYRDMNVGNLLHLSLPRPAICMLIDFGNARMHDTPRRASTGIQLDADDTSAASQLVARSKEDFISANSYFSSLSAIEGEAEVTQLELFAKQLRGLLQQSRAPNASELPRLPSQIETCRQNVRRTLEKLEQLRLRTFDDRVSLWYLFLFALGWSSPAGFDYYALRKAEEKRNILHSVGFLSSKIEAFGFGITIESNVLYPLFDEIFTSLNDRPSPAATSSGQSDSNITNEDGKGFEIWDQAFANAIQALQKGSIFER